MALAVTVGVLFVALLVTFRASPVPSRAAAIAPATTSTDVTGSVPEITPMPIGWWSYLPGQHAPLTLPADAGNALLTSIPDRYLNDPLPADLRLPVSVRGTTGIAALGPPAALVWTEGGTTYSISSPTLTLTQLVDLASALR